ncbi:hypothetical protein SFRURICE_012832 [Spodoptera frugiperda]|nr:hypothetical protein SFRURICE_012832 [Spodoptera frugiperda]
MAQSKKLAKSAFPPEMYYMLRCCGYVWHPLIIFIGTHSLALMETDSGKLCFLFAKMRAMDGVPTIDTSHIRAAHIPRPAISINENGHIVSQLNFLLCREYVYKHHQQQVHNNMTSRPESTIFAQELLRTRSPLHAIQLPSHRVNRAVMKSSYILVLSA